MPDNAEVGYAWDGCVRSSVEYVWFSRSGEIVLSDGDVIYDTKDRPKDAPTESKNGYWRPRKEPGVK